MDRWTGVILAGGLGSRLFPLTQDIPKPLVQVAGKSMLDFAIDHLRYAGIKKIIIVLKHMGEKIRQHMEKHWFNDAARLGDLDIQIPHVDSKDTADALRAVDHLIDTDHILVSMGDIVTNLPLKQFLDFHMSKRGFATISMKAVDEPTQYGVVIIDSDKKIHTFLEKPDSQELYVSSMIQRSDMFQHTNLINTGIYAFNKEILQILRKERQLMDFGKHVFRFLLENKYPIYGFVENYYWMDVGQPRPYLWANWDLLRKYGWPITPRGVEHDGGLWYESFPTHGEGLKIDKPSFIGNNVSLGSRVSIHSLSVICDDVEIGNETTIDKSVVWESVKIGSKCTIRESIVCSGAKIGDGVELNECVVGPGTAIEPGSRRQYEKIVRPGHK
ncbi:MAG: NDP-sugar synthase [Candidatus Lokiarchaeota archaeon]|nr:NDP-sugar synthase [Candidatus Lokiarchaeota archaeon]